MTAIPKRISRRWLQQQQTKRDCTAKAIDGQPNPNYASLAAEIAEAEAEIERRDAFESWVKRTAGLVLNQYPLRTRGETHEAGTVFLDPRDKTNFWTTREAWERYQEATAAKA